MAGQLDGAGRALDALAASYRRGRAVMEGIPCAIVGAPNAGKSTLFNALLGYERAIVTPIPGTTRDTVEETVRLGGCLLRLIDTAGLRTSDDPVEQLGVARSRAALERAELILAVVDGSCPAGEEVSALLEQAAATAPTLVLASKSDLPVRLSLPQRPGLPPAIPICARTGAGLDELERAVATLFPDDPGLRPGALLTNARQAEASRRACEAVLRGAEALRSGLSPDAALTDVEQAMAALGELSGRSLREDITARIFARFCVGK
jgi:tRNA modification GTPase